MIFPLKSGRGGGILVPSEGEARSVRCKEAFKKDRHIGGKQQTMFIGLYEWPLAAGVPAYRGLYRGNGLASLSGSRELLTFFRLARDGSGAAYTEETFALLKGLYEIVGPRYPQTDLLLFSDAAPEPPVDSGPWTFLGFDVCADSRYFSPLGAGLFGAVMTKAKEHGLISEPPPGLRLNEAGLFADREDAETFSSVCSALQRSGAYEIESEMDWRPWAIWRYAG